VLLFVRENVIPAKRQREAIQNRGLDFSLTPENLVKLKAAGASAEMLQLIQTHARPAPPKPIAPALPTQLGDLQLTCAPAECEISVRGISRGSTAAGSLKLTGLPPGPATVEFKRPGDTGSRAAVSIEMGKTAAANAILEPDRQTRESFGEALFKKVMEALGGEAAVRESSSVQAEGSATVWSPDGIPTRWSLYMRNRPDRALFQLQGGGAVFHELAFVGRQFKTSKRLKDNDARELPTVFGMLRDRQLAGLIGLLNTPNFKMVANRDTDFVLTAEGSTQTLTIGLDNDFRPAQVKFRTATGLGSEIVTYSDYMQKGNLYYPKSIQIKADETPRGIEVHFDRVEVAPALKDTDYNLKGKPIPSLAR